MRAKPNPFRPQLEELEDRTLLTARVYLSAAGNIIIDARHESRGVNVSVSPNYYGGGYHVSVNSEGRSYSFSGRQVRSGARVEFYGSNFRDTLSNGTSSLNTLAYGGAGSDSLYGSDSRFTRDEMYGGSGDDWLFGNDGDDRLFGEGGSDQLYGGSGRDVMHGGNDGTSDYMDGGVGIDTYYWYYRDTSHDPDEPGKTRR